MSRGNFTPEYFKIKELKESTGVINLMKKHKIPVTFNQMMKTEAEILYIFVFDDNSVEIPLLLTFCHYFKIKMFKLCKSEIKEIKEMVKHSQLVCITKDCPGIEDFESSFRNLVEKECVEKSLIENLTQIFI